AIAIAPSTDAAVRGLGRHAPELVRGVAARVTVVGPGVAVEVEVRRREEVDGQRLNARRRLGRIENDAVGLRRNLLRGLAALRRAARDALRSGAERERARGELRERVAKDHQAPGCPTNPERNHSSRVRLRPYPSRALS